jgi:L-ascorbate metabolism protein UlaG (beta-lactamase superfamily)
MATLHLTYIGGPTALLEFGGARILTDPTFDPAPGDYPSGPATLRKLTGPALSVKDLEPLDFVLLSHDHHFDNLDRSGREMLGQAKTVLTTEAAAGRLGANAVGLKPWESTDLVTRKGDFLRVAATPARHGPAEMDRGPVVGFIVAASESPDRCVYFAGDTVWYEGVQEVARRFHVKAALLNLGAARVPQVGPFHLIMTADEAVKTAQLFQDAVLVPLHFEGWAHFSEGRVEIGRAFDAAGLTERLRWPDAGRPITIDLS